MHAAAPIPLELVLSGRDLTEPKLSPDGGRVAFVERWRGASTICVVDLDPLGPTTMLTFGPDPAPARGFGGGAFCWLADSIGIVYAAIDGELWRASGTELGQLTFHGRTARSPGVSSDGSFVVYALDDAEIWFTELATGRTGRLDDGRHAFCFDPALSPDDAMVSWQGWSPPAMPWDAAERVDCRDPLSRAELSAWRPPDGSVQQPRFAPDGTPTCVHDGSGWLNVSVGERGVLTEDVEHGGPTWGIGQRSYAFIADGRCIVARNRLGFSTLSIVDPAGEACDLTEDFVGVYGQLSVVGDRLVALRSAPTSPPEIVVIDLATPWRARVVARSGPHAWTSVALASPEAVTVRAADAVLHARHYPAGLGRLLCWVHGGPTDQWSADFRPRVAYWQSRGWDVLVVDPRGTTGHGRAYQRALNGRWGWLDVDDTAALIRHCHAQGWATPATTVAIGGSSGGLTVLGLLADHGALVAAAVASYPVSDIAALADSTHRFEAHYTDTLVGPQGDHGVAELMASSSPINRADQINVPMIMFHGSDDPVVPVAHSAVLADRIRRNGGDVELVVYEGEGHGFRDPAIQRDEYECTERFLDRVVGPVAPRSSGRD